MKALHRFHLLQAALIALAVAVAGYAVLLGRLLPALLVAAAATLAAALIPGLRGGRDPRPGHGSGARPVPDPYENGQDRPRRSEVALSWLLASTVGGALGGLGFVLQFFGQLVLFGGLVGLAQWLVLQCYLARAGWWVPASFFGWFAGSVAGVFGALPLVTEPQTTGLVYLLEAWVALGAFQSLALYGLLGAVAGRRKLVSLWLAVSVVGGVAAGVVANLVATALSGQAAADLLPEEVAGFVAGNAGAGAIYGAATGVALAEVLRRRAGARDDRGGVAETRAARPSAPRGRSLRRGWTVPAAGLLALISLAAAGVLLLRAETCSKDERAAYGEFAQYGGRRLAPERNWDLGSCQAFYALHAPPGEVVAYFSGRLRANGWKVETLFQPPPSAPPGSPTSLVVRRGDYRYSVEFNPSEGYGDSGPGGKVAIDVYED